MHLLTSAVPLGLVRPCWRDRAASCSQVATDVTIWTTSPFSPWMAPWMASFTSMSVCRAGASSAAWDTWKTEGEGRQCSESLHMKRTNHVASCMSRGMMSEIREEIHQREERGETVKGMREEAEWQVVDKRWAICILTLRLCLWSGSDRVRYCMGKKPLKDERLMTQSWMMTTQSDSLLPPAHAKGSLKHTCSI